MARNDLTEGPVWKALARVSAPMSFGILAVLSVGVVDAYFLGQLGEKPLAAIGFIFPVTTAFSSLAIGLSAGANAAVSQSLGRDDPEEKTARYALHAFAMGIGLAALISALVWLTSPWLFSAMGAGPDVLDEISLYMPFWALSFPFLAAMMIVNAVFRAYGNGATSAVIMVFSAIINIALNPLLIFGWGPVAGFGTEGAAMASAIARTCAAGVAIWYAVRCGYLKFAVRVWVDVRASVTQLLRVSAPAAFSNAINPAGMAFVTAAVATLGDAAVAGFGAATRVQSVATVALFALSAGIGPVVGQNWGADKQDRARMAVRQAWVFCLGYGVVLGIGLALFSQPIASAIASSEEAAKYTAQYVAWVGWSMLGYGMLVTTNAAMNARSKAVHSMVLSLLRIFAIFLPLAWLGVWSIGYSGILLAAIAANLFGAFGSMVAARAVGLSETDVSLIKAPAKLIP